MVANKGNDLKVNTANNKRIGWLRASMIIRISYGALIVERLDIHGRNIGNFMASQPHLAKSEVTMEASRGIMGKRICLLFN